MSVDGAEPRSAGELFGLLIWDVECRARISVLLNETVVDEIDDVRSLAESDEEVRRLEISVDEILRVEILDSLDHLIRDHQHCLQHESLSTVVEEVLQGRPEVIHHEDVEITFLAEPVDARDPHLSKNGSSLFPFTFDSHTHSHLHPP